MIHLNGFTPTELESYRQQIWVNLGEAMSATLDFCTSTVDLKLSNPDDTFQHRDLFFPGCWPDLRHGESFPQGEYREAMESLWKDARVQEAVARGSEVNLPEK